MKIQQVSVENASKRGSIIIDGYKIETIWLLNRYIIFRHRRVNQATCGAILKIR